MTFILKKKTKLRMFADYKMIGSVYSANDDITLTIDEIYAGCVNVKYDINKYGMVSIYCDLIVLVDTDDTKIVMYDYNKNINHIIEMSLNEGE